jgi:glycosyltransferase involved in cell wall biosynthesis
MSAVKKVLFIGHDGSRTGAPIVLLHLLRWLKSNTDISFEILLRGDGELRKEYEALAPVWILNEKLKTPGVMAARIGRRIGLESATGLLAKQLAHRRVDLIYSNTVENWSLVRDLAPLQCPIITHVHELEYWIRYKTRVENFRQTQKLTSYFVAASEAVKKNLVDTHQIPESKIGVVHEFIPTQADFSDQLSKQRAHTARQIRKQLNIPEDAMIVGGSGTTDWRKGADLFIRLAASVVRQQKERQVYFVWLGGQSEGGDEFGPLWLDVKNLGLGDYVKFLGAQSNPLDYFSAFDVFALVSREDCFPLVMLECAALGKPILCFADSGGATEFVDESCGFVSPYLDTDDMAARILELQNSPELRRSLGERAAEKVRANHDVAVSASKIRDIIERVASSN